MTDKLQETLSQAARDFGLMEGAESRFMQEHEAQIALARVASEMVRPLMEAVAKLLTGNVDALQQINDALNVQNERMAALERVVKRRLPVTSTQVRYMNDAIRNRARALLDGKDGIDGKAYTILSRHIRRDVQVRCGIASLREMPDHEYSVSMDQIRMWSDALIIRNVIREARERVEDAEQSAGMDGA